MRHTQDTRNHPSAWQAPRRHLRGRPVASGALVTAAVAAAALLMSAGSAGAGEPDWSPRTPLTYPSVITVACGATPVDITFPVNREYQRTATLADGTQLQEVTGALTATYTAAGGRSVTRNTSGPGLNITYPNGDQEIRSRGQYGYSLSPLQASELGVPQIFATTGLIDYIIHKDADQSITPITVPHHVDNVCAMLGL